MKRWTKWIVVSMLAAEACVRAASAQPGRGTKVRQPTKVGTAVLRVIVEEKSGLGSPQLLQKLFEGPGFQQQVLEIAKFDESSNPLPPTIQPDIANLRSAANSPNVFEVPLTVAVYDDKMTPEAVILAAANCLAGALANLDPVRATQEEQMLKLLNRSNQLVTQVGDERRKYAMRAKQLGVQLDEKLEDVAAQTLVQKLIAEVTGSGLVGRREAIERQIAVVTAQLKDAAAADETKLGLERIVALLEQKLALERKKFEAADEAPQVLDAESRLAEARASLMQYRRSSNESDVRQRLAHLQQQLDQTQIELAEQEQKVAMLRNEADRYRGDLPELAQQRLKIEVLERDYVKTLEQVQDLELRRLLYQAPSVVPVIGATLSPPEPTP
jgi:hypothetical protein